jgi:hypothetical protein
LAPKAWQGVVQPSNRPTVQRLRHGRLSRASCPLFVFAPCISVPPLLWKHIAEQAALRHDIPYGRHRRSVHSQESRSSRARFSTNNHRTSTGLWLTSEASMAASLYHCMAAPLRRCINAHSMLHACSHRGPPQSQQRPAAGAQAKRGAASERHAKSPHRPDRTWSCSVCLLNAQSVLCWDRD